MSRRRSANGSRMFNGRLFELYQVEESKADADSVADRLRKGELSGLYGYRGPHFVRVVPHAWGNALKWTTAEGTTIDLNRYAVYCFPNPPEE